MTHVHYAEYARQARDAGGHLVAAGEDPPLAEYRVAIGVAAANTPTLNDKTRFVEVSFRGAAHMTVGKALPTPPAATVNKMYYGAGAVLFRGVPEVSGLQYSVIQP